MACGIYKYEASIKFNDRLGYSHDYNVVVSIADEITEFDPRKIGDHLLRVRMYLDEALALPIGADVSITAPSLPVPHGPSLEFRSRKITHPGVHSPATETV
jgi:hypothetical protein